MSLNSSETNSNIIQTPFSKKLHKEIIKTQKNLTLNNLSNLNNTPTSEYSEFVTMVSRSRSRRTKNWIIQVPTPHLSTDIKGPITSVSPMNKRELQFLKMKEAPMKNELKF